MSGVSSAAEITGSAPIGGGALAEDRAFAIVSAATPGQGPDGSGLPIVCPLHSGRAALVGVTQGRDMGVKAGVTRTQKYVQSLAAGIARSLAKEMDAAPSSAAAITTLRDAMSAAFIDPLSAASGSYSGRRQPSLALAGLADDRFTFTVSGDCRAYLLRDGVLRSPVPSRRRTSFSPVRRLAAADPVSFPAGAAAGGCFAAPGDVLLLCSARLPAVLSEERIAQLLTTSHTPAAAVRRLLEEAHLVGGEGIAAAIISYSPWIGAIAPASMPINAAPPILPQTPSTWRIPVALGVFGVFALTLLAMGIRALWPQPAKTVTAARTVAVPVETPASPAGAAETVTPVRPAPAPKPAAPVRQTPRPAAAAPARVRKTVVRPRNARPPVKATARPHTVRHIARKRVTTPPRAVRTAARVPKPAPPRRPTRVRRLAVAVPPAAAQPATSMGGIPAIRR